MKTILRFVSLVVLVSVAAFYTSCKEDTKKKTKEQIQFEALKASTWRVSSASLDNVDRVGDFTNLTLTVSGTFTADGGTYQYSFTGSRPTPSPWPSSGTFKFGTTPETKLIRLDDDIELDYTLTATQFTVSFDCASCDYPGGRVGEVNGNWEFVFNKQ